MSSCGRVAALCVLGLRLCSVVAEDSACTSIALPDVEGDEEASALSKVVLLQSAFGVARAPRLSAEHRPSSGYVPHSSRAADAAEAPAAHSEALRQVASQAAHYEADSADASLLQAELSLKVARPASMSASAIDCSGLGTTLGMYVNFELAGLAGFVPGGCGRTARSAMRPEVVIGGTELLRHNSKSATFSGPVLDSVSQQLQQRVVLGAYFLLYTAVVVCICRELHSTRRSFEKRVHYTGVKRVKTDIDVEEETLKRSWIQWLGCSWATQWVARWGHGGSLKIKPDDLPQMGDRENQSRECARSFDRLWREELAQNGEQLGSLFRVIVRMWTRKSMVALMVILGIQMMLHNLYTVVLVEHSVKYFVWLQGERNAHPGDPVSLTIPLIMVILIFSAAPGLNMVLTSMSQHIARRLDQRVTGALSVAIFEKAQRLPLSHLQPASSDDRSPLSGDGTPKTEVAQPADMMQLIGFDIYQSLQGSFFQVCSAGNSFIACIVLSIMLWMRLGRATLVAVGVAMFVLFVLVVIAGKLGATYEQIGAITDRRVQAVREMLVGIRVVKCYGWEEAMDDKISTLRKKELGMLETYWYCLGAILGVVIVFPRALVISALAAYSAMYGSHSVANILVCMQILYGLKASCETLGICMGRAITIEPSLNRIESFLRLPEAPLLMPDKVPSWVGLWQDADHARTVALHGSFSWVEGGRPALRNLSVNIPHGELVAVVGKVGSGKSTLLQAVLGELYPTEGDGDAEPYLKRPRIIAYCPQVPHIAEGTLKDNVLFGQDYDQDRYDEAISAAALTNDLKVLPGGDLVPIGSRGIALSGGQKVRVSLARAAYHADSKVVLLDDPFGSVDAPTAAVLLEKLLLGSLMQDRTRIVVLQPDDSRLRNFDRVLLMEDGCIVEQGPPEAVFRTDAYRKILSNRQSSLSQTGDSPGRAEPTANVDRIKPDTKASKTILRDEDYEHRPTVSMIKQYCQIGRYRNFINVAILYFVQVFFYLISDLVLANWTNAIAFHSSEVDDFSYVSAYVFWLVVGTCLWPILWRLGMNFTLNISREVLGLMLAKILRAPIDKFFDKHPVGRIMNRVVADMAAVDFHLYMKAIGTVAVCYYTIIPILYVHSIMPWWCTILAMPLYYLIATMCMRYWNTTVPFRYCAATAKSDVNSVIGEVTTSNAVIRAYGHQERITTEMCDAVDNELKADLYGQRVLKRWLINRIILLWSFYTTSVFLVSLLNVDRFGAGSIGLCLSMLFVVEALIEPNLDSATGAQMELISLARIHEYLSIPQEEARWKEGDGKLQSFFLRIPRRVMGLLRCRGEGPTLEICQGGQVLLRASPCGTALVPLPGTDDALQKLCPGCPELTTATCWHRVVAVGDAVRNAQAMATELCSGAGDLVRIEVQSGWLADGARVEVEGLRAGYGDSSRDVLKGISFRIEPKAKVGIVGTTGCGKSSLLLVLLRVIEPRDGRVLLNGVDTTSVGLGTLRRALGLVPQDPVLFSGTLRHNLDPLGVYSDSRIMAALGLAQVRDLVAGWSDGLDHVVSDEGGNLSFGQRQLFCLARMILRQPPLLLLDEATSAIDPRTQEIVQETIESAFASSTIVAIAHRLETIADFDYVCVMDGGDIVEKGAPKEVAERPGGHLNRMLAARCMR
mmetsp:Transcript_132984/g.384568  ORF Transcript_132984/g.384568 Transcript_132984/m.384568 type:complete len:1644 (+) Transcript_132984:126-5057(+)